MSDSHVTLLCAALENLPDETDDTVRLRRLMVAGRVFVPILRSPPPIVSDIGGSTTATTTTSRSPLAIDLAQNLGLVECVQLSEPSLSSQTLSGDAKTSRQLALELHQLLSG